MNVDDDHYILFSSFSKCIVLLGIGIWMIIMRLFSSLFSNEKKSESTNQATEQENIIENELRRERVDWRNSKNNKNK